MSKISLISEISKVKSNRLEITLKNSKILVLYTTISVTSTHLEY